jgi:uncharacterized protein YciI
MVFQQFITILKPTRPEMITIGPTKFEEKTVTAHYEYLEECVEKGIVILAGRTLNKDEKTFGIVIFKAGDIESARQFAANDPVISNDVMRAEVFPFRIALPQRE